MAISPVLRQLMVAVSTQLAAFSIGGAVAYPTLLMEHFRSNQTSIQLDMDTKSWIGSIYGLAGIPAILMPIITQSLGRKFGYIITCTLLMIGWILTYTARNTTEILISESFHGLGTNSLMPVSFLGLTEMLAPKYRFVAMQTFGIIHIIGVTACGIMGRFLHFKTVSIIMFIPITAAMAIALLWPDSPSWFAYKGEFQKCERAFFKLRGKDASSKRELRELIAAQRENLNRNMGKKRMPLKCFWKKISSRDFYMPSLHTFILLNMMYWSGCDVIYIYFIEIVAKSTNNEDTAMYAGIIMYVIITVGTIATNFLVIRFRNKQILLSSTCGVIVSLFCGCIVTILQSLNVLAKHSSLLMYCLIAFVACSSLGLNSMVFFISAELMPVKHRSLGGALFIIFNCTLYASSLKLSPYLFMYIDLSGTFLIYIMNAILCALYVWKYVPETKRKSLQEIEDFYINGHFYQRNLICEDDTVEPILNTKLKRTVVL